MAIIEQAAISSGQACESGNALHANTPPAAAVMPTGIRRGYKTIEQIYAEHLERFPQPFTEGPMSVDIVRQDRDSR